jgi:hypothetical protein
MVLLAHLAPQIASVAVVLSPDVLSPKEIGTLPLSLPADRRGCVQSDQTGGLTVLFASVLLPTPEPPVTNAPAPMPLPPGTGEAVGLPVRQRSTDRLPDAPPLSLLWLTAEEAAAQHRTGGDSA